MRILFNNYNSRTNYNTQNNFTTRSVVNTQAAGADKVSFSGNRERLIEEIFYAGKKHGVQINDKYLDELASLCLKRPNKKYIIEVIAPQKENLFKLIRALGHNFASPIGERANIEVFMGKKKQFVPELVDFAVDMKEKNFFGETIAQVVDIIGTKKGEIDPKVKDAILNMDLSNNNKQTFHDKVFYITNNSIDKSRKLIEGNMEFLVKHYEEIRTSRTSPDFIGQFKLKSGVFQTELFEDLLKFQRANGIERVEINKYTKDLQDKKGIIRKQNVDAFKTLYELGYRLNELSKNITKTKDSRGVVDQNALSALNKRLELNSQRN